ncbi:DUF5610 domain-containing protein [Neptuniibacter sp.]|uniref:DUF5610 domain-containing protein n=1 Tax=Neptuniibacter sp. TaxID=1962643 RepID=UPI00260CD58E|nr:DUF5610 domain-containing protein [Neptuniibacter sp.]MCP4595868.1 hypothetical protein [Neptuniibacter sp.]
METNTIGVHSTQLQGQKNNAVQQFEKNAQINTKQSQNLSILQQSYEVSLSTGNESQALLYKAAIEQLNEVLEPDLGSRPLDSALESGLDVSPEAVADRIVTMTTGMFSNYLDIHPELSEEAALERFMNLIGEGILQGFEEAREILDGLNVLEGEIASNIDQTYDLVLEGLDEFTRSFGYAADNLALDVTQESELIGDEAFGIP